ncbi:uncharacterized protein V6R79_006002 [Siganus canaliculatus]
MDGAVAASASPAGPAPGGPAPGGAAGATPGGEAGATPGGAAVGAAVDAATEEEPDEGLEAAEGPMEMEADPAPVRIVPIPVQPGSPPGQSTALQAVGALSFKLNGRPVSLRPGGGSVELKLGAHPRGSSSGFITVQIPVPRNLHGPAAPQTNMAARPAPTATAPPSAPDPTPIITGVVSGEAAQRVLSNHAPLMETPPPAPQTPKRPRRAGASLRLLHRGQLGPVSPPDCVVCFSQYKLIPELRGFMCLCSPVVAQSLKALKKKSSRRRWSRDKKKTSRSKASRTRLGPEPEPGPARTSGDFLSERHPSPAPLSVADHVTGKLVIMVEDFYYGSAPGRTITPKVWNRGSNGSYRCLHCPQTLSNNIRLMFHLQQHVSSMSQQDGAVPTCSHCFQRFSSSVLLRCHLQAVHSQCRSTAQCRICERQFPSEPAFLLHMKTSHKPGEMPYVCQVCDFRSSFYSDVWSHFEKVHADTIHLLCQYCLRVLRSSNCYQQHVARHQRKQVFSCDRCRLHFLFVKERLEHKRQHHRTHVRPPQLTGLRPGTKVTVRTYSVVRDSVDGGQRTAAPCQVVDVKPAPPQDTPTAKRVESLAPLLANLRQDSEESSVSRPALRCIECLSAFQVFSSHFPSQVRCSLCRFLTCCSTSYANHMINNHSVSRRKPPYPTIFCSGCRLSRWLRCVSCWFSTCRGDAMAAHLAERADHRCLLLSPEDSASLSAEVRSVQSARSAGGGAFIPIHLLPSGHASIQLSVKTLTCPAPLSSPPAMTITFLGPRPQSEQSSAGPLSVSQLSVVLFSLCHGVPRACRRFHTSPASVRSWIRVLERQLADRKWPWRTDDLAEWVLTQRELQHSVGQDVLLPAAVAAIGGERPLLDAYRWIVDFLLRHQLSLQPVQDPLPKTLPRRVLDNSRAFVDLLSARIRSKQVPPHHVGCMDEFPVFINMDQFSRQNPEALQLSASPQDRPRLDVVLSALADGTFLPPMLFLQGSAPGFPEGFPKNVLLEARLKGFTDQDRLQIWTSKVWGSHVGSQRDSILMVDVHRGHMAGKFRSSLTSRSTDIFFIPLGCSSRLQPLDVAVTPVLRDFLQARWTQLVSQEGLDGLGLDQLALTLACWLSEVCSTLNSDPSILRRSFSSVCDLQQVDFPQQMAAMIQTLTQALVQPVETPEPPAGPGPELELLLVMEEEKHQSEEEEEEEELEGRSPSALRQMFDGDSDQESFHGFHDD